MLLGLSFCQKPRQASDKGPNALDLGKIPLEEESAKAGSPRFPFVNKKEQGTSSDRDILLAHVQSMSDSCADMAGIKAIVTQLRYIAAKEDTAIKWLQLYRDGLPKLKKMLNDVLKEGIQPRLAAAFYFQYAFSRGPIVAYVTGSSEEGLESFLDELEPSIEEDFESFYSLEQDSNEAAIKACNASLSNKF